MINRSSTRQQVMKAPKKRKAKLGSGSRFKKLTKSLKGARNPKALKLDRPKHTSFFDRNIPDHKHEDDKIVPIGNPSDLYEIGPKNTLLPAIAPSLQQLSGFTTSDDPKIRPPGIQLNRKYGGSLTQRVQDLLRNLSWGENDE